MPHFEPERESAEVIECSIGAGRTVNGSNATPVSSEHASVLAKNRKKFGSREFLLRVKFRDEVLEFKDELKAAIQLRYNETGNAVWNSLLATVPKEIMLESTPGRWKIVPREVLQWVERAKAYKKKFYPSRSQKEKTKTTEAC